jgi:DNA-3-methyladenine glycosylase
MKVNPDFYLGADVLEISRNLLGKILITHVDNEVTAGKIVETEAYCGLSDRASHAYPNKLTPRNRIMFEAGGVTYIYFVYGIHHMFNIVTGGKGLPNAILVRALEPVEGMKIMLRRRGKDAINRIASGPGSLCLAMGIDMSFYGLSLQSDKIWIEEQRQLIPQSEIVATTRIGVDYAGEDAFLNWRFYIKNNPWISRKS